jgi:hypothetical protein
MELVYQYEINEDILYAKYIFPKETVRFLIKELIINNHFILIDNG